MLALALAVRFTSPRGSAPGAQTGPDVGALPAGGVRVTRAGEQASQRLAPSGVPALEALWLWSEGPMSVPVQAQAVASAWDELRAGLRAAKPTAEAFSHAAVTIAPVEGKGPVIELTQPFAGRVLARAAGSVWSVSPGAVSVWLAPQWISPTLDRGGSPLMVVPSTAFDRARLESPARTIAIVQERGLWTLREPIEARADESYCLEMLRRIASIPAERSVRGGEMGEGSAALRLVVGSALPDGTRLEQTLEVMSAADRQGQEYFAQFRAERIGADGARTEAWSPRGVTIARSRIERLSAEASDYLPATPVRALPGDVRSVRWGEAVLVRAGTGWQTAERGAAAIDRGEALEQLLELATRLPAGAKAVNAETPAGAATITLREASGSELAALRVWTSGNDEAPTITIGLGPAQWTWPAERAKALRRALEAR